MASCQSVLRLLVFMALASGLAVAQEELAPSTQDGPMQIHPAHPAPAPTPKPDPDGIYRMQVGVLTPWLIEAIPAEYPADAPATEQPHICIVSAVIGSDAIPSQVETLYPCGNSYGHSAIEAVKHSRFQAGTLDNKRIPVLIQLRVPFSGLNPAIPMVLPRYAHPRNALDLPSHTPPDPLAFRPGDSPPRATYTPEAEFSDAARRNKIDGAVLVSLIVSADGLPTDIRVIRGAGWGLDENAIDAVSRYRFTPALRDGKPIPARISVQVNFRIYRSPK